MLARLQLLTNLVPIWGLASAGGEGLPLEGLMKFVGAAFGNANAEVRSAAIALAVLVRREPLTRSLLTLLEWQWEDVAVHVNLPSTLPWVGTLGSCKSCIKFEGRNPETDRC